MGRRIVSVLVIVAVALVVWLPTLGWGLPSREADKHLFGDRQPWTGRVIVALTATSQPSSIRGADVDADPILDRSKPVVLNDTDAKRAAIVRRYRLMSGQPDEFIQFKALSEMAGRSGWAKLDPRLYQYGGLWTYPVGALCRAAMIVGFIPSPPTGTPAIEFYLDHPEAFGRFYVVARFYSWFWGVVAALAIVWIARRITGHLGLATLAAVAFMLTPVVRTATHEAKPHLAGAALCLCAVIAATKYVETGRRRWLVSAGVLCGAAMAMVVSMLLSCVVLPTMVWLRWRAEKRLPLPRAGGEGGGEGDDAVSSPGEVERSSRDAQSPLGLASGGPLTPTLSPYAGERGPSFVRSIVAPLLASLALAAIVYLATNPFVLINAVANPQILRSNLGNSTAMYGGGAVVDAFLSALRISAVAMTATGFIVVSLVAGRILLAPSVARPLLKAPDLWLLGAPMCCVGLQYVALAAGKPAEYSRFAIFVAAGAIILAAASLSRKEVRLWPLAIALSTGLYLDVQRLVHGSQARHRGSVTYELTHGDIAARIDASPVVIGVAYEPAPWSSPPIDLFSHEIVLVDPQPLETATYDVYVVPSNLASQRPRWGWIAEEVDWRSNVHITRLGRPREAGQIPARKITRPLR